MNPAFEAYLLRLTAADACEEVEVIQSLWSGYGKISRYRLAGSLYPTIVVKCIDLENASDHPRGWDTDFSHQRKVKSYKVETDWYKTYSGRCNGGCRIPEFLGFYEEGDRQWIVMEDLDLHFPIRKTDVVIADVKLCLVWLANFHATFLNQVPKNLWVIGTYWHLETRPDEFKKMEHVLLKAKAHKIDEVLNNAKFQTFVHGDAKLANFCFARHGGDVAAVDFQYVGGGCGMKDVAYFLGSCLSSEDCMRYESTLLSFYFSELEQALEARSIAIDFSALELDWRHLYPFACADFTRFLLGWMPNHRKVNPYNMKKLEVVLDEL